MSMAANACAQAQKFEEQAKKRLNSWALFNKQAKFEDAAELYAKAGAQYKIAKEWENAGRVYEEAGKNADMAGNSAESLNYYTNAGKAYKQENGREAVRVFSLVVGMLQSNNKFSTAGKIHKTIAEIWEGELNVDEAMKSYRNAAECFEAEDSNTTANQMMLKVADFAAEKGEFGEAIDIYQKVASKSLDSALTKWSVTDYFFKAALCSFVQESQQSTECKSTAEAIDNYVDQHPAFQTSRECVLLLKLVELYGDNDVQGFTDALFEYNQISQLDNFKSGLLLKVKRRMIDADNDLGEAVGGGAEAPADDDVPDFT